VRRRGHVFEWWVASGWCSSRGKSETKQRYRCDRMAPFRSTFVAKNGPSKPLFSIPFSQKSFSSLERVEKRVCFWASFPKRVGCRCLRAKHQRLQSLAEKAPVRAGIVVWPNPQLVFASSLLEKRPLLLLMTTFVVQSASGHLLTDLAL